MLLFLRRLLLMRRSVLSLRNPFFLQVLLKITILLQLLLLHLHLQRLLVVISLATVRSHLHGPFSIDHLTSRGYLGQFLCLTMSIADMMRETLENIVISILGFKLVCFEYMMLFLLR